MATILKVDGATNAQEHLTEVTARATKDSIRVRKSVEGATTAARPAPLGRAKAVQVAIECVIIEK